MLRAEVYARALRKSNRKKKKKKKEFIGSRKHYTFQLPLKWAVFMNFYLL